MSLDQLQEKIISMKNPTVAGLDPRPEFVPDHNHEKAPRRKRRNASGRRRCVL